MAKIKRNDKVIVIAGKDKGQKGNVLKVLSNDQVLVEGVNLIKKHQKGNPQKGVQPGIIQKEKSLHISNVAIFNDQTNKADRVRYLRDEQGNKYRAFASNNEKIDL